MKDSGVLITWISETATSISSFLSDPMHSGGIFAVIVLVILYSIVSSIRRLDRAVASASAELSAVRSALRKIELSVGRIEAKRPPGDREGLDIRDLLFRVDEERAG